MTRETRIGLVVGLMFIVLFGVVLSELGPTQKAPADEGDQIASEFYVGAPVTPAPQRRRTQDPGIALVARPRTTAQGPGTARSAHTPRVQPQRRVVTPRRAVVTPRSTPRPAPRRRVDAPLPGPIVDAGATRRRVDSREMTLAEFARSRGVGAAPAGNSRTYVTRRGDNLTAIARKFYRSASQKAVMKIYNANRKVLKSPDSVHVGVKLVIPN
jgi:nucleoid-associated protein YgaU